MAILLKQAIKHLKDNAYIKGCKDPKGQQQWRLMSTDHRVLGIVGQRTFTAIKKRNKIKVESLIFVYNPTGRKTRKDKKKPEKNASQNQTKMWLQKKSKSNEPPRLAE